MRTLGLIVLGGLFLAGLAALAFTGVFILSARTAVQEPPGLVISLAEMGKPALVGGGYTQRTNPITASPDILANARRLYTARCVVCHGTDGKGTTTIGSRTFPRAADLTSAATQNKPDGMLFWFVEMGIPHTGMPGWQGLLNEQEIWQIVTYMRELPKGVPAEAAATTATSPPALVAPAATTAPPAATAAPTTAPTSAPAAATTAPIAAPTPASIATTAAPTPAPQPTAVPPPQPTAAPKAAAPAATSPVTIADYAYDPQQLTVAAGTRVVWTNLDADVHTVTSEGANLFDSGEFGQNATFTFTFTQPGEYSYYCVPHDYMKGKVIVR